MSDLLLIAKQLHHVCHFAPIYLAQSILLKKINEQPEWQGLTHFLHARTHQMRVIIIV